MSSYMISQWVVIVMITLAESVTLYPAWANLAVSLGDNKTWKMLYCFLPYSIVHDWQL